MISKIYFPSSSGVRICGDLSAPSEMSKEQVTILCHGFASGRDSGTNKRLEKFLSGRGLHSLRFDFFGHGESGGNFSDITVTRAVEDVKAAHNFLKECGYRRFGLVGSSFGGLVSILAASELGGLERLALKSPVSDYLSRLFEKEGEWDITGWKQQGYHIYTDFEGGEKRLAYKFYEDAAQRCGYEAAVRINVPTLIVHGEEDETVPVSQSIRLAEMIPDCRLHTIPGADHRYSEPDHFERMISLIENFIQGRS